MNIRDVFNRQGEVCGTLGSPFLARLLPLVGERLRAGNAVANRVLSWPGDTSASGDSVPLRLAGALHGLKLDGLALNEVYPPNNVCDNVLWHAVDSAVCDHEARIFRWLDLPPQTNEVRRAAPLAAVLGLVSARYGLPIELLELGCSAGLNLRVDHFRIETGQVVFGPETSEVRLTPEWQGSSPPQSHQPIIARRGVDLAPIDPLDPPGRLRLRAYLWPDQPDRLAWTDAAIRVASRVRAEITRGDAGPWAEQVLATDAPDRVRLIYHTIAWQYFPGETHERILAAMENSTSPLVRFGMEADGGHGARLSLTHYPNGQIEELGRADFHGRWVDWTV